MLVGKRKISNCNFGAALYKLIAEYTSDQICILISLTGERCACMFYIFENKLSTTNNCMKIRLMYAISIWYIYEYVYINICDGILD